MTPTWKTVAEALRTEVLEYGQLLQLFEEQQALLFRRDASGVLRTSGAIERQVDALGDCRETREQAVSTFARDVGRPESSTVRSLLEVMPDEARPLVLALITDLTRLAGRVRRTSRQNRLFLIRTVQNHQDLLRRLRPGTFTRTYAPNGRVSVSVGSRAGALVAEG